MPRSLFARLRNTFFSGCSQWITEDEDLAIELERLDREDPEWDRESRKMMARYLFEKGRSRESIIATYGEDLIEEIENEARIR